MWHAWGRREINTAFWLENLTERDCLEDLCIGKRILQLILKKYVGRSWTGFIWLRTETNDEHSNDLQISYSVDNFLTISGPVTFSRGTLLHENFYVRFSQWWALGQCSCGITSPDSCNLKFLHTQDIFFILDFQVKNLTLVKCVENLSVSVLIWSAISTHITVIDTVEIMVVQLLNHLGVGLISITTCFKDNQNWRNMTQNWILISWILTAVFHPTTQLLWSTRTSLIWILSQKSPFSLQVVAQRASCQMKLWWIQGLSSNQSTSILQCRLLRQDRPRLISCLQLHRQSLKKYCIIHGTL